MCRVLLTLAVCIFWIAAAIGQVTPGETKSPRLDDYELIQYITSDGPSPNVILDKDNNGDLLVASQYYPTREELSEQGFLNCESQIALLQSYRLLIEADDEKLSPAFPILDSSATGEMRRITARAAGVIGPRIRPAIDSLVTMLGAIGRADNAYAIAFSYVLDGLTWDVFEEQGLVKEREISAEEPFWSGVVWAVQPSRGITIGTNTISDSGVALKVSWSDAAIPKMIPFVADWKNLGRMFTDYRQLGRVIDPEAKEVFAPFDLYDQEGRFTIPVILETADSPLYQLCRDIAARIVTLVSSGPGRSVTGEASLQPYGQQFGFTSESEKYVIMYHELMWDLLFYFEEQGTLVRPPALATPDRAEASDIADLVFIVRESAP